MSKMNIQKDYKPIVESILSLCQKYFDSRLLSIYIGGSVGACEAWPWESDVDSFIFLKNQPCSNDEIWQRDKELYLKKQYPVAKEVHLNLYSLDTLRKESFWRFILRYNSLHIYGKDLLAELKKEGIFTNVASREFAKGRIGWPKKCLKGLIDGRLPDDLFQGAITSDVSKLDKEAFQATRKLARNFVLLEGAYVLMLDDIFESFRQKDVLPALRQNYPEWNSLILKTENIFKNPFEAKISPKDFAEEIIPFVQWAVCKTKNA